MRTVDNRGFQPVLSFVSITILGIILAQYVFPSWKIQIILMSIILGGTVAAIELRSIVKSGRKTVPRKNKISDEEAKLKLAKYVAEVFDEDIPFDDSKPKQTQNTDEEF
ncbi:MAG: hypothetical protein ACXAD7_00175 [Candidatus Kariarchaeaceae archaeon]|jgi:hypothetical protein